MARRRYREQEGFSGINITPLMDLTFLLLIVFMITAPMLEYSINVSPPKMDADPMEADDSLLVTLDAEGRIFLLRKEGVTEGQLKARLAEAVATRPQVRVFVRAHEDRAYREVIGVMRAIREAGLHNVALVTQAED